MNMDIKTKEERSRNMSRIRSRDTSAEVYIRHLLFARGYRYRIAPKEITGKPDLWFPGKRVAIFVHGCFWHRHQGCRMAYMPKSRVEFWQKKFDANVARDRKVKELLAEQGIRWLVIWECTIRKMQKDPSFESRIVDESVRFLMSDSISEEL